MPALVKAVSNRGGHAADLESPPSASLWRRARAGWLASPFLLIATVALALVFLSLAAAVGSLVWLRDNALAAARHRVADYTYLVSEQTARTLQTLDLSLQGIVDHWRSCGGVPAPLDPESRALLERRLSVVPFVRAIFLVDEHGRVTQRLFGDPPLLTEPAAWLSAKAASSDLVIAPPATSAAGPPFVRVARPLATLGGAFCGFAVALLDPNHLLRMYGRLDLGDGGAVALYLQDGTLVLRYPMLPRESPMPGAAPRFHTRAGLYDGTDVDGVFRISGFHGVIGYPVVVTVGLARADALAAWERDSSLAATLWLLFVGAVIACAVLLAQHMRGRQQHAEALADLARFPAENPHPVLRLGRKGNIRYLNRAAAEFDRKIRTTGGDQAELWQRFLNEAAAASERQTAEFEALGRTLHFSIAPVSAGDYVNVYGTDITALHKQERELRRINRALAALAAANRAVAAGTSRTSIINAVCAGGVEAGYAFMWIGEIADVDGATRLVPLAACAGAIGPLTIPADPPSPASSDGALARAAIDSRGPVRTEDPVQQAVPPQWRDLLGAIELRAAVALPVPVGAQTSLAIVIHDSDPDAFGEPEISILDTLAKDIGYGLLVVDSVQHYNTAESGRVAALGRLDAALVEAVTALSAAIEKRDPYTAGHQRRVAELAVAIARELGLATEQVKGVQLGSLMHDIGKIGIPAEILAKPGALSAVEREFINTHPQVGYDIVEHINLNWPIGRIVMEHHERLDGSGYPKALKAADICLEARIVGVADVVEAMMSHRPYRPALGMEAALEEITTHRGTRFDPAVVDACVRILRERIVVFATSQPA